MCEAADAVGAVINQSLGGQRQSRFPGCLRKRRGVPNELIFGGSFHRSHVRRALAALLDFGWPRSLKKVEQG